LVYAAGECSTAVVAIVVQRHLHNGKTAAVKVGEHFAENNVMVKAGVTVLEGFSEDLADAAAWELCKSRPDKAWSLVDCMASVKRHALNQHLLGRLIRELELDSTSIKSHPSYQTLQNYGIIAA
jgi:hypothetical protein